MATTTKTPAQPNTPLAPPDKDAVDLKLAQAYTALICSHPFFATLLLRLHKVEDFSAPTMWVDGKRLGYNPHFVMQLTKDELIGVLCHEVMHVAALHPWRCGTRNKWAANIAMDKVVNHIVQEAGFALPKGCIPGVPDKAWEELYVHPPEDEDQSNSDPGGTGEVREPTNADGSAQSEAQREHDMQEAKIATQQALNAAKRAGQLPAGLKRFAEDLLEPKVPWREILNRFVDAMSRNDYSWTRPNRKFLSSGVLFPSLWSPAYGMIMMGCDTSGSIDQAQLKEVCSEVLGALDCYAERGQNPELTVAWFDHAVYPQVVSDADELEPQGGGGTSFKVVMDFVREAESPPRGLVMVTDGYCNDFGEDPGIPVLWVLTRTYREFNPPFGELCCTLNED